MKLAKTLICGLMLSFFASTAFALDPVNTSWFGNLAIKGYDPVAYFLEDSAVKGKKSHQLEWGGATWQFSSAENKTMFENDPDKYAPQYGGYCAWAVSQNTTADIEPEQFTITQGKLYLNYNKSVKNTWLKTIETNIETGNKNWPKLLSGS